MSYLGKSNLQINGISYETVNGATYIQLDVTGIIAEQLTNLTKFMKKLDDSMIEVKFTQTYGSVN